MCLIKIIGKNILHVAPMDPKGAPNYCECPKVLKESDWNKKLFNKKLKHCCDLHTELPHHISGFHVVFRMCQCGKNSLKCRVLEQTEYLGNEFEQHLFNSVFDDAEDNDVDDGSNDIGSPDYPGGIPVRK